MYRLYLISEYREWLHPHEFIDKRNAVSLALRWMSQGKIKDYRIEG